MQVVIGAPGSLPGGIFQKLSKYRHKVFIEKLGWELQTPEGMELDQFDRHDTVYVVAQDEHGSVNGCARLLPTTSPYLLAEVFPQLLQGTPQPCSPDVWELSRFAAVDFNTPFASPLSQFSSPVAVGLLQAALNCAATRGAKRLITVSPLGIERLLRKAGFHAHRVAPPVIIDGHPIFACWIEVASSAGRQAIDESRRLKA